PCATRSDKHIAAARAAVLRFFDAPEEDYICIFTSNATNALKIVGESFPFGPNGRLIIPADCHNSVNGLRTFAQSAGSSVDYLESTPYGGFDVSDALNLLKKGSDLPHGPSLFVLTGQSNITGIRPSVSILHDAKNAGFSTLIDAAALASSARISLRALPDADAMAVSFYKMFGYPTGVGALIAKKSFLSTLRRKWFSGGTVDFVQAPGQVTLHAKDLTARFEEGTLNYSSLSAIAAGLEFLTNYMPYMTVRLPILHHYLHNALESLVYPGTQTPLVRIHTRPRPSPLQRSQSTDTNATTPLEQSSPSEERAKIRISMISRQSITRMFSRSSRSSFSSGLPTPPQSPIEETTSPIILSPVEGFGSVEDGQGYVVSCTFYTSSGRVIPLSHVSRLASRAGISLRTGCVCNPGGSAALRGKTIQERMDKLSTFVVDESEKSSFESEGEDSLNPVELKTVCEIVGGLSSAGVVRLSLGMASNFEDVWRVVSWARTLLDEATREKDLETLMK
ncbi:hypothetical protein FRC16_005616, partial [Serendipita sp. 398]